MQQNIAACPGMVKDAGARLGQEKNGQVVGRIVAGGMLVGLRKQWVWAVMRRPGRSVTIGAASELPEDFAVAPP